MLKRSCFLSIAVAFLLMVVTPVYSENIVTTWDASAEKIYEDGFVHNLMKNSGGGVSLFNMELVENDSPGGGQSENLPCTDKIWGKIKARKILEIGDVRAESAWIIIFPNYRSGKYPLKFTVNGNESAIPNWDTKKM